MTDITQESLDQWEQQLKATAAQLEGKKRSLAALEKQLVERSHQVQQREIAVKQAERQRDAGYAAEREKLDEELFAKRNAFDADIRKKREIEFNRIAEEAAQKRKEQMQRIDEECSRRKEECDIEISRRISECDTEKEALNRQRQGVAEQNATLEKAQQTIDFRNKRLQTRQEELEERENQLTEEIERKIKERKQSFERESELLREEIERLRESIDMSTSMLSSFEDLKRKLGGEDPAAVLLRLRTAEEANAALRAELVERPVKEMQEWADRVTREKEALEEACRHLSEENNELRSKARDQARLEMEIAELSDKNTMMQRRFEAVEAENNRLAADLKRFSAVYEQQEDREARIKSIEEPLITVLPHSSNAIPVKADMEAYKKRELPWLQHILDSCDAAGLHFPQRIVYAFHTALKTAEFSPITVLAGVSGTGKSELPRLYARFGGLTFLNLAVQPNWDSQESMLGFFNSIDNKFDAQPVLRLLAQSQKPQMENYPYGLKDALTLILLDEMNLAHVELYFAEFLSKLELRRGLSDEAVPQLEVKLGAGIRPYHLPLGKNVLWAGTMNQDETTKSLSDKVLDRGIIIHFPRPSNLERRRNVHNMGTAAPLLPRAVWESWVQTENNFTDELIAPFKHCVETINASLSTVGRALGHRVWQSIEYYMANYPTVLEAQQLGDEQALHGALLLAFEDQLVQKVMPKLRGIETRGKAKADCLDKIREQLDKHGHNLLTDFDLACEFGYGQFIWNSAEYLKEVSGTGNL